MRNRKKEVKPKKMTRNEIMSASATIAWNALISIINDVNQSPAIRIAASAEIVKWLIEQKDPQSFKPFSE